jgi:hypothetical protein
VYVGGNMKEGFVALLDVLGFSDLAGGDATGERMNRYLECVRDTMRGRGIDYVVFSDSIVLNVKGDDPQPLAAVAGACSQLLGALLNENIALRGAIAFGGFVREAFEGSIFVAGRAVIDAYRFEKHQDWIGVMLAPSAVAQVRDLTDRCRLSGDGVPMTFKDIEARYPWPAFIQRCYNIPFHASSPFETADFDGFAVVPTSGVLEAAALRDSIKTAMDRLSWLRVVAPTPDSQRKYQRTLNWISQLQTRWHGIALEKEQAAKE